MVTRTFEGEFIITAPNFVLRFFEYSGKLVYHFHGKFQHLPKMDEGDEVPDEIRKVFEELTTDPPFSKMGKIKIDD